MKYAVLLLGVLLTACSSEAPNLLDPIGIYYGAMQSGTTSSAPLELTITREGSSFKATFRNQNNNAVVNADCARTESPQNGFFCGSTGSTTELITWDGLLTSQRYYGSWKQVDLDGTVQGSFSFSR